MTEERVAELLTDYDLAGASVRSLAAEPSDTGLRVTVTLAAPRRFIPSTGRVAQDGSRKPWPHAPLQLTFDGVTDMQFDAEDRHGAAVICDDRGVAVSIGRGGVLRATSASVRPNDPRWHESAAGYRAKRLATRSCTNGSAVVRVRCPNPRQTGGPTTVLRRCVEVTP